MMTKMDVEENGKASRGPAQSSNTSSCILQVIPELGAGGAEQTVIDVTRAIVKAGGRALVATGGGFRLDELRKVRGEPILIPAGTKNPYGMIANILRLAQIIDRDKVDIVHARSRAPAWSALAAARLMGRPFLTTYHGTYNAKSSWKRFYNSVMVKGDAVIANSHFIADHIRAEHKLREDQIDIIPRGTDLSRFDPDAVDNTAIQKLRADWGAGTQGAPDNRRVLLLPGRLTRWKGHQLFLDALGYLKENSTEHGEDWLAVIVGDHQGNELYRTDLENLCARYRIKDRVLFRGHVSDMPTAYMAADIVVAPSIKPEAFGRVPVEAQAMLRPVIAPAHGGAMETVINAMEDPENGTGWLAEPGDVSALARTIETSLDLDWPQWGAMGRRGRENALAHYSLDGMTDHTLSVYDRVLTARSRR